MTLIENRPLGHSGIQVSVLGLGCNQFGTRLDLEATGAVINAALSGGIAFLDTADRYGGTKSEEYIGQILGGAATRWCSAPSSEATLEMGCPALVAVASTSATLCTTLSHACEPTS